MGEDGALKEALKRGDLQKMVEIVNSVGSILNYIGRQAEVAEQGNLTEAQAEEAQKSEDLRKEVCDTNGDHFDYKLCRMTAKAITWRSRLG